MPIQPPARSPARLSVRPVVGPAARSPRVSRQTFLAGIVLVSQLVSACASSPTDRSANVATAALDPTRGQAFDAWWLGYRLLQRAIERESGDLAIAGAELVRFHRVAVPLEVETRGALPAETTSGNAFLSSPFAPLRALASTHSDPMLTRRLAAFDAGPADTSELRTPPHHVGRLAPEGRVYVALPISREHNPLEVAVVGELHSRWSLWIYGPDRRLACNDTRDEAFAHCRVSAPAVGGAGLWDLVVVNESDRPMSYLLFVR